MNHGVMVAAAILRIAARYLGQDRALIESVRAILIEKVRQGVFSNVVRVDSFGLAATGDTTQFGRLAFYVYGATRLQRDLSRGDEFPWLCIDLESADDVAYILAARDELHCTYGVEPVTVYGEERIRATADDTTIPASGD